MLTIMVMMIMMLVVVICLIVVSGDGVVAPRTVPHYSPNTIVLKCPHNSCLAIRCGCDSNPIPGS